MKFSYKCPKCSSSNVIEIVGSTINHMQKIPLTKWGTKNAVLDRYICTDCGYTEEYVQLTDSLNKWARKQLDQQDRSYDEFV